MARLAQIVALALGLVMLRACAWVIESDAGNVVRVMLAPARWPDDAAPGVIARSDGAEVRIERVLLAWSRVTLVPCAPTRSSAWLGGAAHAHSSARPFVVERSRVMTLLGPSATELASLDAPSGRYCRVILSFEGASADAIGVPRDVAMQGRTLRLDGYLRASPAVAWQTVALHETAAFELAVGLGDGGIELVDGRALVVTLTADPEGWFDGVTPDASDAARRVLENVRASLALEAE